MTALRRTQTQPPVYYVHSENDLDRLGVIGSYGLAAGYLSARSSGPGERVLWERVFRERWKDACATLADGLKELGVDGFAVVPCTRVNVMEEMCSVLRARGLRELPGLIMKTGSAVSFAGKDGSYIAKNTAIGLEQADLHQLQVLAVCDDFAETGKTLFGLHAASSLATSFANERVIVATPGISRWLANTQPSDRPKLGSKLAAGLPLERS
jgi:hypothetical protein